MESSELSKVPKRDDKTLASELLRPPEGEFEAVIDDGKDYPPMIEPIRRDKTGNEKIVNGPATTRPDEANKPNLEFKHVSTPILPADHVSILDKLRDAELELGKRKQENAILREENTRLKEVNLPPRNPDTSILESLKKKLEQMKEGYQLQVKYMNETTEEEIHEACKKVLRERERK